MGVPMACARQGAIAEDAGSKNALPNSSFPAVEKHEPFQKNRIKQYIAIGSVPAG
jgi:hypothetical protein